jgi:hypothetical protein
MSRLRTSLPVVAVAGLSLTLAACGGSSGGGGAASTTATNSSTQGGQANGGGTQSADFQKFQQCLKDNGVTLPNRGTGQGRPGGGNGYGPPPGTGGASSATPPTTTDGTPPAGGRFGGQSSDPKVQKAMQACAKYRPQFNGRGGNGAGRPQQSIKAFTPYLTCLKDKGLDVKVSDGFNALRGLKQDDPKVQAALKACQSKIPQRQGGGGGASSSTPSSTTGSTT